jgi:D-glycero-alpha-D-manno-heptose-7-phosphate kinase
MIITRTPFRISFFGGGTDYPAWYHKHGGAVLATTIDKYCYLTCRYLPPFFEHRFSIVYSKIETSQSVDEVGHPAVREVLRHVKIDRGVEIHYAGDLPARSGMGSSSSFTVGLLHALYALKGRMLSKQQLALESIYIEQVCLEEAVGSQDQVSAAYGGFNHIAFLPDGGISVRPVTITAARVAELESHLMLFYTGIKRTASEIAQSYLENLERKERQVQVLATMVDESITILGSGEDIADFGRLLAESWKIKSSLSLKISNSYVEELYHEARSAGAIGGKLTGAGGGGFLLLFVPPSNRSRVLGRLNRLLHVPFRFSSCGSQVIFFDPEEDYSVPDRDRASHPLPAFQTIHAEGL